MENLKQLPELEKRILKYLLTFNHSEFHLIEPSTFSVDGTDLEHSVNNLYNKNLIDWENSTDGVVKTQKPIPHDDGKEVVRKFRIKETLFN